MPVLVNPYLSFGGGGPIDLTEPWGEVARQESVAGGKLTISGLDLSGLMAIQVIVSGVTVTTDDSLVSFRFYVTGSEVSTGYRYAINRSSPGTDTLGGSNSGTEIPLSSGTATFGVGNASTEGLGANITTFAPAGSLYKRCVYRSFWLKPNGDIMHWSNAAGHLENTGAITGVSVFGSSDLTGGSLVMLGVE